MRSSADGIPILLAEVEPYLQAVGPDLDLPLLLTSFGSLCELARYMPQLLAPRAPLRRAIREALARHAPSRVGLAVELGCSVGADLRTLSEIAHDVIGIDLSITALRAAQAQLAGEAVPLLLRVEGRSFRTEAPIRLPAIEGLVLAVGNALDPPLFPEVAEVVLAVNLLDSVPSPLDLIGQIDAILKPGGLVILTSPMCWTDSITPPEAALGGGTQAGWATLGTPDGLVELLSGRLPVMSHLRYDILDRSEVPWTIREHARSITSYEVHVLVARKALPRR